MFREKDIKGRDDKTIRYECYRKWARLLKKSKIGTQQGSVEYHYPHTILNYLRAKLPLEVRGEIREDAYAVSMQEFCLAVLTKK